MHNQSAYNTQSHPSERDHRITEGYCRHNGNLQCTPIHIPILGQVQYANCKSEILERTDRGGDLRGLERAINAVFHEWPWNIRQ